MTEKLFTGTLNKNKKKNGLGFTMQEEIHKMVRTYIYIVGVHSADFDSDLIYPNCHSCTMPEDIQKLVKTSHLHAFTQLVYIHLQVLTVI